MAEDSEGRADGAAKRRSQTLADLVERIRTPAGPGHRLSRILASLPGPANKGVLDSFVTRSA